jgi:hypothetical protein
MVTLKALANDTYEHDVAGIHEAGKRRYILEWHDFVASHIHVLLRDILVSFP